MQYVYTVEHQLFMLQVSHLASSSPVSNVACPQLKRAKHWWGISSYQRAGGASRADEEITHHCVW